MIKSGSELVILDLFIESTIFCDGNFKALSKLKNFQPGSSSILHLFL